MKKLFLTIAIIALVILLIAAVLALLSLFNLVPFFSNLVVQQNQLYVEDQATILIAYVDSLEERQFNVEETWLVYLVTSRMDTGIIHQAEQAQVSAKLLRRSMNEESLKRLVEKEELIDIDYIFLIDEVGQALINNLLENQQSSINLDDPSTFCEILLSKEVQLFNLYLSYADGHVRTTIPSTLIEQLAVNENPRDSFYCESIKP